MEETCARNTFSGLFIMLQIKNLTKIY